MGFFTDLLRGINDFFNGLIPMEPEDAKGGEAPARLETLTATPSQPDATPVIAPLPTGDSSQNLEALNPSTPSQPENTQPLYAGTNPPPTTQGTVTLQVYVRPSDAPQFGENASYFEGFNVSFEDGYGVTDSGGMAMVTGNGILPYRQYYVTVSKAGYETASQPISFTEYTNKGGATIVVPIRKA